jgi:hypothetical protein
MGCLPCPWHYGMQQLPMPRTGQSRWKHAAIKHSRVMTRSVTQRRVVSDAHVNGVWAVAEGVRIDRPVLWYVR